MSDKMPMTVLGKKKLEEDLKHLMQVERPQVIKSIEEARSHGDISENAEYDAAKERQAMIEGRIAEIQSKIASAEVVDPASIKSDKIVFGATVTLVDCDTNEEVTYQIVGVDEANVQGGKISIMSPIARALIGKRSGEQILVHTPKGERELEVLKFEFK